MAEATRPAPASAYPAFERLVAPARRYPQVWRLALGVVLVLAVYLGWTVAVAFLMRWTFAPGGQPGLEAVGDTPGVMVLLLLSFAGMGLGTWLAARLLHRRGLRSLIGYGPKALRHFTFGAVLILAIQALAFVLAMKGVGLQPGLPLSVWLVFLPLALLGVLLQTGAEELLFRGYIQQQLAARFASPFVWMVLPSLAFGMLHFQPGALGGFPWPLVGVTALFGLIVADLTARTGTLGLAWGLHFANNLYALLIVAPGSELSGLALWRAPLDGPAAEAVPLLLAVDALALVTIWGVCRLALRRG